MTDDSKTLPQWFVTMRHPATGANYTLPVHASNRAHAEDLALLQWGRKGAFVTAVNSAV